MPRATTNPSSASQPAGFIQTPVVEHPKEYVLGFPCMAAVTIRPWPDAVVSFLPHADLLNLRQSLGVEVVGSTGVTVHRNHPHPHLDPEAGQRGITLRPGEARRMLADISPLLGVTLIEGDYTIKLSYLTEDAACPAAPFKLRVRKPTAPEAALLASVAADRAEYPTWAAWAVGHTDKPEPAVAVTKDNLLKVFLLFRQMINGPEPLEKFDPARLGVIDGPAAPEGLALQAELFLARGDRSQYLKQMERATQSAPGLEWWKRMTDGAGYGFLATHRRDDPGGATGPQRASD